MTHTHGYMLEVVPLVVMGLLALSFLLAFVRLVRGTSLPDRVVALDLIAYNTVGFVAVGAIAMDAPSLLQPALVLAFIAFLGTVAFARYIEKRATRREDL